MTLSVGIIGTVVMGAEHARILRDEAAGQGVPPPVMPKRPAQWRGGKPFTDPQAPVRDDRARLAMDQTTRTVAPVSLGPMPLRNGLTQAMHRSLAPRSQRPLV